VAIVLQNVVARWGGENIDLVRQVEMDLQRGPPVGRQIVWTLELGQVRISTFAHTALAPVLKSAEYGKRKILEIKVPQTTSPGATLITLLNQDAIYQDVVVQAEANDVLRLAHVFRLMDTVGAGSVPSGDTTP
jgi:hypothetical protein